MSGPCRRAADFDPARYLDDPAAEEAHALREHARGCRDCRRELAAWEALRSGPDAGGEHPEPELLLAYADRPDSLAPDAVRVVAEHLALCASCRDEVVVLEHVRVEPVDVPAPARVRRPAVARWRDGVSAALGLPVLARSVLVSAVILLLALPLLARWALHPIEMKRAQVARVSSTPQTRRANPVQLQRLRALGYLNGDDSFSRRSDAAGVVEPSAAAPPAPPPVSRTLASEAKIALAESQATARRPRIASAESQATAGHPSIASAESQATASRPKAAPAEPDAPAPHTEMRLAEPEEAAPAAAAPRPKAVGSGLALFSMQDDRSVRVATAAAQPTIDFRPGIRREVDRTDLTGGFMLHVALATAANPRREAPDVAATARPQADATSPVIVAPGRSAVEVRVIDESTRADLRHRRRIETIVDAGAQELHAMRSAPPRETTTARGRPAIRKLEIWVDVDALGPGPYRIEVRAAGSGELLAEPMELSARPAD